MPATASASTNITSSRRGSRGWPRPCRESRAAGAGRGGKAMTNQRWITHRMPPRAWACGLARLLLALLLGMAPGGAPRALAQQPALSEADVKAGCIYNFVKFVDWPAQ